jgi:multidrug efflux system membrane fusion protein
MGWVLVLVVLAAGGWFAYKRWLAPAAPPVRKPPPTQVRTVLVQARTVPVARSGVGTVLPVMSVTVKPRVDGQLERVEFSEGQDVKAGQVLARIDPRSYQAQLDQSLAQQARDEAALANARADLARYEELMKEDATTRQTLDTQRAQVNQLQAAVQTDQAQVALARVNLSYTTITAPISGRAGARLVDPGNIVHAADAGGLLVINQIDPIAVQFTLPESAFADVNAALHAGAAALPVQALDRATHALLAEGKLVLLNNQIDTSTGTIALKAHFANPAHQLWPGQSVEARIVLGQREGALTVPAPVVQRGPDRLFAYVVEASEKGDTVRAQTIEVADMTNGLAVVTQGLAAGERVVADGQYRLTPGARIAEAGAGASSPASAAATAASAATSARP